MTAWSDYIPPSPEDEQCGDSDLRVSSVADEKPEDEEVADDGRQMSSAANS